MYQRVVFPDEIYISKVIDNVAEIRYCQRYISFYWGVQGISAFFCSLLQTNTAQCTEENSTFPEAGF